MKQTCNLISNFISEWNKNVVLFNMIINNCLNFKSSVDCKCSRRNTVNKQSQKRLFRSADNIPVKGQRFSAVHPGIVSC